jgi:preprotein translocase subunit SecA
VLNARKHTEESQIIAGAGAFGAVTIATNMAGRGVDIKLGGDVAEEVLAAVARVLRRAGYADPYDMSHEDRRQALLKLTPDDYSIYAAEINFYLKYMDDMQQVKKLGGLHVIGSVRHEARRIDNQLRGRSARQGDPGSSRFYLSMEDELMRLFGGQQADAMMQRLKIDDAVPLEFGLVGRLIEQAQTRVEGNNFDVRKHLLEYDDVLNSQRTQIYHMRDRIFVKDDLSEDVTDMLGKEVLKRVPEALEDEEGPWKLLSWLETIQPTMILGRIIFPSYTFKLLLEHITVSMPVAEARQFLLETAQKALQAEADHLLTGVQSLLAASQERLQNQLEEHSEVVDTYLQGLGSEPEEEPRNTRQALEELSALVNVSIKLTSTQQHQLELDPDEVRPVIHEQVEAALLAQTIRRLLGSVVLRLGEQPNLNLEQLLAQDWDNISQTVMDIVKNMVEERQKRYLDLESGLIVRDLDSNLEHADGSVNEAQLCQLMLQMSMGVRTSFDRRTHRRVSQRTSRLNYIYYAAHLLGQRDSKDIADDVLDHLEHAQRAIQQAWGVQEVQRLANNTLLELGEKAYHGMQTALDDRATGSRLENAFTKRPDVAITGQPIRTLPPPVLERVIMELGRQALTEVYRQLLLRVISGEWVEYLTQVEALRVSIGVESYGQDPLVQYKLRASDLFDALQDNIQLGVVSRMFTFRPQEIATAQVNVSRSEAIPPLSELPEVAEAPEQQAQGEQPEEEQEAPQAERPARQAVSSPTASRSARRRRHRRR